MGDNSAPTFADINKDGDLDAFIGDAKGNTAYFQNTGSATNPKFAAPQTNPFGLSRVGDLSKPTFADIDSDGGLDAFIGAGDGNTNFFQNTPTVGAPRLCLVLEVRSNSPLPQVMAPLTSATWVA